MAMSVTFYCRESKCDRKGLASIEACVCMNKERVIFSLPRKEKPSDFKKAVESKRDNDIKQFCELMRRRINQVSFDIMESGEPLTSNTLREYMKTGGIKSYPLSSLIDDFLRSLRIREICDKTFDKYRFACNMFLEYAGDIQVYKIDNMLIEGFMHQLFDRYTTETVCGYSKKIKMMIKYALANNRIKKDPFAMIKIRHGKPNKEFLTEDELDNIRQMTLHSQRLDDVRNLFLFQASTGMSYCDIMTLRHNDIKETEDGIKYIMGHRGKTGVEYCTVILPLGIEILEKYGYSLPVISNQKYNSYLKEIGDIAGIGKKMHSHLARKTFATSLINKGYSAEIISKMLGHSNTKITQSTYAFMRPDTVVNYYRHSEH